MYAPKFKSTVTLLLFLFSKKDEFIFSYTFYIDSIPYFCYYTFNKCKIYFDFELLFSSAQIKADSSERIDS